MKKLAIALTASAVLGVSALPASAQGVYIGVNDGWWGGRADYGYYPRYYSPRAEFYAYRDRPYYGHRRYYRGWDDGYRSYGYRYRWDDY
jgi:hypothetical protein